MRVVLNGREHELPEDATLVDAVRAAAGDADRRGIAVALDGAVVPRVQWSATRLGDGRRVEVLEARQGG